MLQNFDYNVTRSRVLFGLITSPRRCALSIYLRDPLASTAFATSVTFASADSSLTTDIPCKQTYTVNRPKGIRSKITSSPHLEPYENLSFT